MVVFIKKGGSTVEYDRLKQVKPISPKRAIKNIYEHAELINAVVSGLIILFTWIFSNYMSETTYIVLHLIAFIIGGYYKAKEGITETIKNKDLNVEMLMIIAAIGASAIGYWTEAAILIFIFALSGALESYTMKKSTKAISLLMEAQPEEAILLEEDGERIVPVSELKIGDQVLVRAGERIPTDGSILKGSTSIDESAITGESIPVTKNENDHVYAGTVAMNGTITVNITTKPNETLFQKIIEMVQNAQEEKSPSQLFIEKFEGTYVKVVLVVVAVMMFLPYLLFEWSLSESVYRAMILLVVASPCALVASISPATLSAISNSARKGVLFKGGIHIENLSHLKAIAFDKTGTLTKGKPVVTEVYFTPDTDQDQVLAIAGAIEKQSTHPLAQAITAYTEIESNVPLSQIEVLHMKTESGKGVTATVNEEKWMLGNIDYVGREQGEAFLNGIGAKLAKEGNTVIYAKANGTIQAVFALRDTIRSSSKKAIKQLKAKGVHTIMLTGDNRLTAEAIAKEAGIEQYIADCLPEEKVTHLKTLKKSYENIGMVGDGINDAPALATANVGIAMGEGTDIALETADVVLMKNDLSKITEAIRLSERMNRIIKQNIIFSLAVIVILILSNYFQAIDMPLGVIGHEGSTILVILNGLRLLK